MDTLAFIVPKHIPGWIEKLPNPKLIPTPAEVVLLMLAFYKAVYTVAHLPPRPRKLHYPRESDENKHVVKIKDCRRAIEKAIKGTAIAQILAERFLVILAEAIPLIDVWDSAEDLFNEKWLEKITEEKMWQPLVDECVFEIAELALQQRNHRHNGKWLEGPVTNLGNPDGSGYRWKQGPNSGHTRLLLREGRMHFNEGI